MPQYPVDKGEIVYATVVSIPDNEPAVKSDVIQRAEATLVPTQPVPVQGLVVPAQVVPAAGLVRQTQVRFGRQPTRCFCHSCNKEVQSMVTTEPGLMAVGACVLLCCIGCDFGCCLIPFCVDGCKVAHHRCPDCHISLGKSSK